MTYSLYVLASIVDWHVTTLSGVITVREELAHKLLQGESALLEDASFSVLAENDIILGQGCC